MFFSLISTVPPAGRVVVFGLNVGRETEHFGVVASGEDRRLKAVNSADFSEEIYLEYILTAANGSISDRFALSL